MSRILCPRFGAGKTTAVHQPNGGSENNMGKKKKTQTAYLRTAITSVVVIPLLIVALLGSIGALIAFFTAGRDGLLPQSTLLLGIAIYSSLLFILLLVGYLFMRKIMAIVGRALGLRGEKQRLRYQAAFHRLQDDDGVEASIDYSYSRDDAPRTAQS